MKFKSFVLFNECSLLIIYRYYGSVDIWKISHGLVFIELKKHVLIIFCRKFVSSLAKVSLTLLFTVIITESSNKTVVEAAPCESPRTGNLVQNPEAECGACILCALKVEIDYTVNIHLFINAYKKMQKMHVFERFWDLCFWFEESKTMTVKFNSF